MLYETFLTKNLLFTGVYGDVQRVKILYNKKDSALIQMAEPHQAYLGKLFLFTENIKNCSQRVVVSRVDENVKNLRYCWLHIFR